MPDSIIGFQEVVIVDDLTDEVDMAITPFFFSTNLLVAGTCFTKDHIPILLSKLISLVALYLSLATAPRNFLYVVLCDEHSFPVAPCCLDLDMSSTKPMTKSTTSHLYEHHQTYQDRMAHDSDHLEGSIAADL